MEANVAFLIIAGCCMFYLCMSALGWAYGLGDEHKPKSILTADLVRGAVKGFSFGPGLSIPNIEPRKSPIKPTSFVKYTNFKTAIDANVGPVQKKDRQGCETLCFDTEGCVGYTHSGEDCQLKAAVTVLSYSKGDEIYASSDVGGPRFMHFPFGIVDPIQPTLEESIPVIGEDLGQVVSNCWKEDSCLGFTYANRDVATYSNVLVLDASTVGNTFIRSNTFDKTGIAENAKYTDTPTTAWTLDPAFIKPTQWSPPPAPPPAASKEAIWATELAYFDFWPGKELPSHGWDAGWDKKGQLLSVPSVTSAGECANVCSSNGWCQSFVVGVNGDTGCWLRNDLSSDNTYDVCDAPLPTGGCTAGQSRTVNPSQRNSKRNSYFRLQDPLKLSCPGRCGTDSNCKAANIDGTTCKQYDTIPTGRVDDLASRTVWKFENFPR